MVTKQLSVQDDQKTVKHRSSGQFLRKAILVSSLAVAPLIISAQTAPKYYGYSAGDTTSIFGVIRSIYQRSGQSKAGLEYVTGVQTTLVRRPKENMLLPEGVVLSIAEQKILFHQFFTENDKYAFFYFENFVGWPYNNLHVFRKKQNLPNSSDTLK